MKTFSAGDANRGFSRLLREVRQGEQITILSGGKPVVRVTSVSSSAPQKELMKEILLSRLKSQEVTGSRNWVREELYENDPPCV